MFTILMNAPAIIAVEFAEIQVEDNGEKKEVGCLLVTYGGDSGTISIEEGDDTYEYYYNHWVGQKDKMLSEADEEETPTESVGPVEGGK